MNSYRVSFEGVFQGQTFTFAIVYQAKGIKTARVMAAVEFPNCEVTEVSLIEKEA